MAISALLILFAFVSAISVRRHLLEGREALDRGKAQLLNQDPRGAEASFSDAERSFQAGLSSARSPWMRVVGWIPLAGRTPDAILAVSRAGEQTAEAARGIAQAVAGVPGGLSSLAPSGGRVPIEQVEPIAAAFSRADRLTGEALATLAGAPDSLLLGPVGEAEERAEEQLRSAHDLLHTGSLLLHGLPGFVGLHQPRRYFFGAQNPAEQRGTGGLIGAYSILTIEDGRFRFSKFRPIQSLPNLPLDEVQTPSDYARNYNQFRGANRFWTAINVTPDFPSAAIVIEKAYEKATGEHLDGVMTADPFALATLMKITGPATISGLGVRITASSVVGFTTNRAYALIQNPITRKLVLGSVAEQVFRTFIARENLGFGSIRMVVNAAAEGHIQVYSDDPPMEEGLRGAGVGGALTGPPGDFFSVIVNSSAGDKVDFYQSRSVTYAVHLQDGGTAAATAGVRLTNAAPSSGQPHYVIGPFLRRLSAGDSVALVNVYCGIDCDLREATRDGASASLWRGSDLGHPYYQDYFTIPSGQTGDLSLSLFLPDAWLGNSSGGTYTLTFLGQTTIRPATLRIEIQIPEGMRVVDATTGMRVQGDTVIWEGTPSHLITLQVSFQPPLAIRLWRDVTRFLAKPVITF